MNKSYNFSGFIWSPASQHTTTILEKMNQYHPILHYYTYHFNNQDVFSKSVMDIYKTDDIDPKKVKNVKLKHMLNHTLSYTFFKLYIRNPQFRKKENGNIISCVVESLKKKIRDTYKPFIHDYVHDIIIHICDNFDQTNEIDKVMTTYQQFITSQFINLKYFLQLNSTYGILNRVDVLVRKHTIENYIKNPDYTFEFYKKMQEKRTNKNSNEYVITFKRLIHSIKTKGLDPQYPIKYSLNYQLRDGSHRLSYALYLNKTFIAIEHMEWDNHKDYNIEWFIRNGFSNQELDILRTELNKIRSYEFL